MLRIDVLSAFLLPLECTELLVCHADEPASERLNRITRAGAEQSALQLPRPTLSQSAARVAYGRCVRVEGRERLAIVVKMSRLGGLRYGRTVHAAIFKSASHSLALCVAVLRRKARLRTHTRDDPVSSGRARV